MDDFRKELTALVDGLLAQGITPMFLMIDLVGAESLRSSRDTESLPRFRETCMASLSAAAADAATFSCGDVRVAAILCNFDRLKTFALIEKMRRMLPLLGQSFDCTISPEFDTIEYDALSGVPGVISQLLAPRKFADAA
jgi:hypothetical protein